MVAVALPLLTATSLSLAPGSLAFRSLLGRTATASVVMLRS